MYLSGNWAIISSGNGLFACSAPSWYPHECWFNVNCNPYEQISVKSESKQETFLTRKCNWKHCLQNVGHFDQASMYYDLYALVNALVTINQIGVCHTREILTLAVLNLSQQLIHIFYHEYKSDMSQEVQSDHHWIHGPTSLTHSIPLTSDDLVMPRPWHQQPWYWSSYLTMLQSQDRARHIPLHDGLEQMSVRQLDLAKFFF